VSFGLYTSANEVIREALHLLDEQDRIRAAKLDQLRQDIQDGLNSGTATAWDAGQIKREAAKRRAAWAEVFPLAAI
jgi:antitoxin ParD1/3/4